MNHIICIDPLGDGYNTCGAKGDQDCSSLPDHRDYNFDKRWDAFKEEIVNDQQLTASRLDKVVLEAGLSVQAAYMKPLSMPWCVSWALAYTADVSRKIALTFELATEHVETSPSGNSCLPLECGHNRVARICNRHQEIVETSNSFF